MSKHKKMTKEEANWKVEEVITFLHMFLEDGEICHLTSAEFALKILIDGYIHGYGRKDLPF